MNKKVSIIIFIILIVVISLGVISHFVNHKRDLCGPYLTDGKNVYYESLTGQALFPSYYKINADLATFKCLGQESGYAIGYAKDKDNVFYNMKIILGADSATAEGLNENYAKDKDYAYYEDNKITDIGENFRAYFNSPSNDLEAMEKDWYALDNKKVYYFGKPINGADPASFSVIESKGHYYSKDKNSLFFRNTKIDNSDPSSFVFLSEGYSKDKNNVYFTSIYDMHPCTYEACVVTDADPNSFLALGNWYGKDKNNAYYMNNIIRGADTATFNSTDEVSAKDKNFTYENGEIKK